MQRRLTLQIGPSSGEAAATSSATVAGCRRSASSPGFRICFPHATSSWISPARPAFHARHLAGPPAAPADQIYRHHLTHLAPRLQLRGSDLPRGSQTAGAPDFPAAAARVHGLAPCAREREVATARASRDADLPPHLQRPSRSPDVGGRCGVSRWSVPGEDCARYVGGGGRFRCPVGGSLTGQLPRMLRHQRFGSPKPAKGGKRSTRS